tara:strand:+ start:74 stop:655 length:582 start_codon:yes stop_codon:yes gene_type:complete
MGADNFDFWGGLMSGSYMNVRGATDSVDMFLADGLDKEATNRTLHELTDRGREKNSLVLPIADGTRVSFVANLGSILSLQDAPSNNDKGTVVTVKSAGGEITSHEGRVFVKWDDGQFRAVHKNHLRVASGHHKKQISASSIRVASLGDLADFLRISSDTLVHKATQDIWSFQKDADGYLIERILGEDGKPLKI